MWDLLKQRVIAAGSLATAALAIIAAVSFVDAYRWWVWADEFQIVAARVYETSIPEQRRIVSQVKRELESAKTVPVARRGMNDRRRINNLEVELDDELDKLKKLLNERTRFTRKNSK